MANVNCCKLVSTYPITLNKCIVSIAVNSSTPSNKIEDCFVIGPTVGSVTMSGYAATDVHTGCRGRAGVSIPWIRKYDCDADVVYFLFSGGGKSYIAGDVEGLARLDESIVSYNIVNASSASGPTSLYMDEEQTDGYGLTYTGDPVPFDSTALDISNPFGSSFASSIGLPSSYNLFLQSFNVDFAPGEMPMANYSFAFTID